ncbi:MAG: DUF475 domain-containing protein [Patescibacteria group bacterium]
MMITASILTIFGLALFEIISSADNAIVNAEVLETMSPKGRKWFLFYGIIFAVFVVRGLLPWLIIYVTNPSLGFFGAFTAALSSDPIVAESIHRSAPILMAGGGIFLVFLFFHWLFLEKKTYGLVGEAFFHRQGVWFFAVVSAILAAVVWEALKVDPMMAFGAVIGSTAFFITHGFKENAEKAEKDLLHGHSKKSDLSKILYLEVIDATFSIDGVLGAFAFTLSVPLILIGNGIGAFILRKLTISNVDNVKKYIFLKNGAMYSIFFLGVIMLLHAFGFDLPEWVSPVVTFATVGYFFLKSHYHLVRNKTI